MIEKANDNSSLSVPIYSLRNRLSEMIQLLWESHGNWDKEVGCFTTNPKYPSLSFERVCEIRQSIEGGSFRFSPLFRSFIPKPNKPGKLRPITQPFRDDILVMDALSQVLLEVFESLFLYSSHGFRKGRGIRTFFAQVESWGEVNEIIKADFVGCFDNINHDLLLAALSLYIDDSSFIDLIDRFLKTDIKDKDGKSYASVEKGIPQGCSLSPLLMNIFLHQFDLDMQKMGSPYLRYVRYADDFLIALLPGYPENVESLISRIEILLKDQYKLSITKTILKRRSKPSLTLGILLSIGENGIPHLRAPLPRIARKRNWKEKKEEIRKNSFQEGEIEKLTADYNTKIKSYLSLYTCCENLPAIKAFLKTKLGTESI